MKTVSKQRLDVAMHERGLCESRKKAQALILKGSVYVNDIPVVKAGTFVMPSDIIACKGEKMPFVSRGGLKLAEALDRFNISPKDCICLDVGASTGGFTDCLLQRGALKVYAVDVGYGQLAWKLQTNPHVISLERTNFRYIDPLLIPDPIDLVVIDVSFISLKLIVPAAIPFLTPGAKLLPMIKPQFEVGKEDVGNGVITDPSLHRKVLNDLADFFKKIGFTVSDPILSPILGPKGNQEFFCLLEKSIEELFDKNSTSRQK